MANVAATGLACVSANEFAAPRDAGREAMSHDREHELAAPRDAGREAMSRHNSGYPAFIAYLQTRQFID